VYYSQLVQNVPPDLRRKVSRIVGMWNSKISSSVADLDPDPHGSALSWLSRNRIRIGNVNPDLDPLIVTKKSDLNADPHGAHWFGIYFEVKDWIRTRIAINAVPQH
jgi:hypothetical protein